MLKPGYKFAPHQEAAHERMEEESCNALFFDMGCFKTSTVIGHVERSRHYYKHVLVVVLKDNLKTWKDELDERCEYPAYDILPDSSTARIDCIKNYVVHNTRYLVVNYDCLRSDKFYQILKKHAAMFDYIVFDEAYATHNVKATRNKRWYSIRKKIPRCTVLDGDPTAEGEFKLFGIYKMMDMGATFGTSEWEFGEEYFVRDIFDLNWIPGRETKQRIAEILAKTSMRVTKAEVLPYLPPVVYEPRYVQMMPEQKKLYNQMAKEFAMELSEDKILEVDYKIAQIQKLKQLSGGFCYMPDAPTERFPNAKIAALKDIMRQCSKLVIWCQYREEIEMIDKISIEMGRTAVTYHGGVPYSQKIYNRNLFKNNINTNDFIGQIDCGIGMNELVVSGTAVYWSRSDKRRSYSQSVARLDRPGQKHDKVTIIDLITQSTIDEYNYKRLKKKGKRSEMLLNYRNNEQLKGAIHGRL